MQDELAISCYACVTTQGRCWDGRQDWSQTIWKAPEVRLKKKKKMNAR